MGVLQGTLHERNEVFFVSLLFALGFCNFGLRTEGHVVAFKHAVQCRRRQRCLGGHLQSGSGDTQHGVVCWLVLRQEK